MPTNEVTSSTGAAVRIVRAFTLNGAGGNPAGIVLDADRLGPDEMQTIAAEVGLSETAFVTRSRTEGARLDFFTPTRRIAHCGHATIAAFSLLRDTGRMPLGETSKETIDGARRILISADMVFVAQRDPRYTPADDVLAMDEVLDALGVGTEALNPALLPTVSDTGGPFLMLAVRGGAELAALRPDHDAVARIGTAAGIVGIYAFTTDPAATSHDATARMFAPHFGIPEESATGMAAGALGAFLHDVAGRGEQVLTIEQGRYMHPASPSLIEVRLDVTDGDVGGVMVGGHATVD